MKDDNIFIGVEDYSLPEPLSKEEIRELFKTSKLDEQSRNKIIEHNIKLVLHEVLTRFKDYDYDKKEFVSIGTIGLVKAVDTYDSSKGYEFTTYATRCIDNEILMFMRKINKTINDVSLDETIANDVENIKFEDILVNDDDFREEIEKKELFTYLNRLINELNERDKKIIMLYFGFYDNKSYTGREIAGITKLSKAYISKIIIKTLKQFRIMLEREGFTELHFEESVRKNRKVIKIKTIYELFSDYTEDEINLMISELTDEDKKLLTLKYGNDLHNPHTVPLSKENQIKFHSNLVKKMKRRLEKQIRKNIIVSKTKVKTIKTIYELFSDYTEEEINHMISGLDENDKKLLKLKYGDDLHNPHNIPLSEENQIKFHSNLVRKMKRRLKNPKMKKLNSIYELFSDYTEDEINLIISELTDEDKKLLTLKYGNDLHNPHTMPLSKENQTKFYYNLVQKMKRRLKNSKLNKNNNFEIGTNNKSIIQSTDKLSEQMTDKVSVQLSEKSNTQLEEITRKGCIKLLNLFKTPSFFQMVSTLSAKEAIIISLKFGYVDGKYFRDEKIAKFLEITEEEVKETIKKIVLLYKQNTNQQLDCLIDETTIQNEHTRALSINIKDEL